MTAARVAEAVVHAAGAVLIIARVDRRRSRKRMPAQPLGCRRHFVVERRPPQRRHRVFLLARTLEWIAARVDLAIDVAGLARHSNFVLNLFVVRFELLVTKWPVFDRRALRNAPGAVAALGFADDFEIPRV